MLYDWPFRFSVSFCEFDKYDKIEKVITKPIVMKFGGTSVADRTAFERVASIVRAHRNERPVVVVSAMSGVTDALLRGIQTAARDDVNSAVSELYAHLSRHFEC